MSNQREIYRKVGRRYEPIAVDGRPWDGLLYGNYVVLVRKGLTSIKRLPEVTASFAEPALRELEDKICRDLDQWMAQHSKAFSRADLAQFVGGAVREFLQGKEVGTS